MTGLRFRHLTFAGPGKSAATIAFGPGLNIIYGASNTGKSFIVDTIDFMLGGKGPLRDIPERVGYDRVLLAVETIEGEQFTLQRSTEGGGFVVFDGLHTQQPEGAGTQLSDIHNDRRDDNLSSFLLSKIGLAGKRIRKNKRNDTLSLSFRNLARLIVVNEEEIIQQRSPLTDGNYAADTPNAAVFKLLLTGVDDSALSPSRPTSPEEHSRDGQLELLDQLIADLTRQVKDIAGAPKELEEQAQRLEQSMQAQSQQLASTEADYRLASQGRRDLRRRWEEGSNRMAEIDSLLERFDLLDAHYKSDLARLAGIEEGGSLFASMGRKQCPLCGALPEHHRVDDDCDGNVEGVVNAARAEISKIELRRRELKDTITSLKKEQSSFKRRLPKIEEELDSAAHHIQTILAPNLRQQRNSYSQLAEKRGDVREALGLFGTLSDLEERKTRLLAESEAEKSDGGGSDTELSTSVTDQFATLVLAILRAWQFPEIDRVHFDSKTRDLVINGKNRISYGKGLRAITHAAFTIGLLEFCRQAGKSHPGVVILDSPLLSYRKPDSDEDDLRRTDLNERFYEYLRDRPDDRQFIIIENTDPPADVQLLAQAHRFTGNAHAGRYGYFPRDEFSALIG